MKYIPLAVLCFPFIFAGCIETGDSGSNPIHGEVVERRALTDEEVVIWNEQAECMEAASKSRPDIEDLNATDVPIVPEITIRKDLMCGNIPPDNLIACQTENEIAILDGLDQQTFNRALRHEEIHYILFFETGSSDGGHKSIWFDIDESPCPETGQ
jgi:hypothetical protein